ncbi:MAG: hypothetical protein MUC87_16150 [Bacteroidia bacterium]|jgi:hypothetical protein|nr:hypothetical protein [Bacteroidia bacterium]
MNRKVRTLLALVFCIVLSGAIHAGQGEKQISSSKDRSKKNAIFAPEKVVRVVARVRDTATVHFGDTIRFAASLALYHNNERYTFTLITNTLMIWGKNSNLNQPGYIPNTYLDSKKQPFHWNDFDIVVTGGKLIDSNVVVVGRNLEQCPGGKISITLTYKRKEGLTHTKEVDLVSMKNIELNLNGEFGRGGYHGNSGSSGNRSNGNTPCQNGTHGSHGTGGNHGTDGHIVDIYIKSYRTSDLGKILYLIYVHDITTGRRYYYCLDGTSSMLRVFANGGDGGDGGNGGNGGDGGEQSLNFRCFGGDGGDGGDGGSAGNGGQIRIIADTSVNVNFIPVHAYNYGGRAGAGGRGGRAGNGAGTENAGQRRNNSATPGRPGRHGQPGMNGPRVETIVKPLDNSLFKLI